MRDVFSGPQETGDHVHGDHGRRISHPPGRAGGFHLGISGYTRGALSDDGDNRTLDPRREEGLLLDRRPKTKKPQMYAVVFHNDDYTTQEFVVHVLMKYFHKDETEATHIMLSVHKKGKGIAGVYTYDIAETKVTSVISYARENGHPLKVTMEPQGAE